MLVPTILTKPSEFECEIEDEELKSIIDDYESSPFIARYWSNQYGGLIRRYGMPNIYLLPKNLDKTDIICSVAHEIGHYNKEHHARRVLIGCASAVIISVIIYSFGSFLVLLLIPSCLVREMVMNYFNHKYEYQADSVASDITSNEHIVRRLRGVRELNEHSSIPYMNKYPSTDSRISRLLSN